MKLFPEFGLLPTGTVFITVFVEVLITLTELSLLFVTYAYAPSGVKLIPYGAAPTLTVVIMLLFDVLMILTLLVF